jgi:hypothetical protein
VPERETIVTSIKKVSNGYALESLAIIELPDAPKDAQMVSLSRAVHFGAPSNLGWTPKVLAYLV